MKQFCDEAEEHHDLVQMVDLIKMRVVSITVVMVVRKQVMLHM